MTSNIRLQELAIARESGTLAAPPRRVFSRYVVPGGVLAGFLVLIAWASRNELVPTRKVSVVPVITTRAEIHTSGAPLFQAPGWIEPRPRAVVVSALIEGVVEELLIVEGQDVQKGDVLARLVSVDAELELRQAENQLRQRQAQCELMKAELSAAKARLERPAHLDASLAEAESNLARTKTERAKLPSLLEAAAIRLRFAEQDLEGKLKSQDAISERFLQKSQSERDAAKAEWTELKGRGDFLDREVVALERKVEALRSQRELLIEEKLRFADAQAKVEQAAGDLRQAELSVESAKLRLARTEVVAPVTGRVLQVVARQGTRVMGLSPNSNQDTTMVATLYDPHQLQVRADVRLEDVPSVLPGQKVQVETASSAKPLDGEVLFITSSANIQKNTLETKIAIFDPPSTIRPEMLAKVTFLAPEKKSNDPASMSTERMLVPRSLIEGQGADTTLWVVDTGGFARRQPIQVARGGDQDLAEVSGIQLTDRLISSERDGLQENERVTIVREDPSLGIKAR